MTLNVLKSISHISVGCIMMLFLLWSDQQLSAQMASSGLYERLSSYNGLSSNTVVQTLEDSDGYIWFATPSGLNRYDGKNVRVFKNNVSDPNSISHNNITCLLIDSQNRFWVGTKGGLNLKNDDDTFTQYINKPNTSNCLSDNRIQCLLEDSNGHIWVGTEGDLNVFNPTTSAFNCYKSDPDDTRTKGFNSVQSIYLDSRSILWLSSWSGVVSAVHLGSSNISYESLLDFKLINIRSDHDIYNSCLSDIFEDDNGRLWGSQYNGDLFLIDFPSGKTGAEVLEEEIIFEKIGLPFVNEGDQIIKSSQYVTREGLYLNTNTSTKFISNDLLDIDLNFNIKEGIETLDAIDLSQTSGNNIYKDSNNIIWVSSNNGVYKYFGDSKKIFNLFAKSFLEENHFTINGIYYFGKNKILLGTSGGLYHYNLTNDDIVEIKSDSPEHTRIINAVAFHEDTNGDIWVGTIPGHLFMIDKDSGLSNAVHKPIPYLNALHNNNHIWNLTSDEYGHIWVSTHQGLFIYDPMTEESDKYLLMEMDSLEGNNVFDIVPDDEGHFWMSTCGGGITKATRTNNGVTFQQLAQETASPNTIRDNIVFDLELVGDDLWIGMMSGIQKYNIKEDSFYTFEVLENNITGQVLSVTHDAEDVIWFATGDGLFSYDVTKDLLSKFNALDGISSNMSILGSSRAPDGKLFFAGAKGFNSFYGGEILNVESEAEIKLTDLKINNEYVIRDKEIKHSKKPILTNDLNETESIFLNYNHKDVHIDFTMLDFMDPFQYRFSYQLEGFNDAWKELGTTQSISFPKLPYGDIVLHVKAKNKYGHWTKTKSLNISVSPPLWQNQLLYVLGFVVLMSLVYFYLLYREKRAAYQKERLEAKVAIRTKELKDNNIKLKQYIESNLKLEQFAHAAAHDLKTPLRTISSYTGLMRKKIGPKLSDSELKYFSYIEDGTKRLFALIGDLMEFSQLDAVELKLKKENPLSVINKVLEHLEILIIEKGAEVEINLNEEDVLMDEMKMSRVFQNIISNALKFMKPGVVPKVSITSDDNALYHVICVTDNGVGIAECDQSQIFEVFNRGSQDRAYGGTGMGLATCKKIIEAHEGHITIESSIGQGSTFRISLPKQ